MSDEQKTAAFNSSLMTHHSSLLSASGFDGFFTASAGFAGVGRDRRHIEGGERDAWDASICAAH
jgi:hypothetical protein